MKFEGVKGLTGAQAAASRKAHGDNELPAPEIESFTAKLLENFEDPVIRILLVALVVTLVLSFLGFTDWVESAGIAVAVAMATLVSTYSEYKNEASFRDLQEAASKVQNRVYRDGDTPQQLLASQIVVGDYVLLTAGDKVPADGVLFAGDIQVDQASLNGEAEPVRKLPPPGLKEAKKRTPKNQLVDYKAPDDKDFLDPHLVFRGAVVDEGEAVLRVRAVGLGTAYGQLYQELSSNEDDRESPLQVKLQDLANGISMVGYVGASFIAISFLFKQFVIDNGYDSARIFAYLSANNLGVAMNDIVTSIILAVIIIVVAVPEGLPMMIAIVLSLNMRKLLNKNVLVRRLLGIETAGSVNMLFVDKTGTLTRGLFVPQSFVGVDGTHHATFGQVPQALRDVLGFTIRESTSAMISEKDGVPIGGNSSDRALLTFLDIKTARERCEGISHNHELLFNSARKFSATELSIDDKTGVPAALASSGIAVLVKGAPEMIVEHCTHAFEPTTGSIREVTKKDLENIQTYMDEAAREGVRIVAIAAGNQPLHCEDEASGAAHTAVHSGIAGERSLPSELALIGVIGILDEVRSETAASVALARSAGIHMIMITGDRRETAESVARQIGLLPESPSGRTSPRRKAALDRSGDYNATGVLTSQQLQLLSDKQVTEILPKISVISRALPTDKSRLVKLAKKSKYVVGMTGDGVNDSAALKKADVGFAMGSGSEVAKEAADIVILDDNFASITQAVLYGRTIFKSIRKFIVFQSTVNVASMLIVFMGPFMGFDFPLTLIQLLWVNLVMDTLAALAFGGEGALPRYMEETPIRRDANIISPRMWSAILFGGIFIGALCIAILKYDPIRDWFVRDGKRSEPVFLTAFFAFFIFLTNFNAFNVRTTKMNLFDNILGNSGFLIVIALIFAVQVTFTYIGGSFLRTVGLTVDEWKWVTLASAIIIPADLLRKAVLAAMSR